MKPCPEREACIAELRAMRHRYAKAGKQARAEVVKACIALLRQAGRPRKSRANILE